VNDCHAATFGIGWPTRRGGSRSAAGKHTLSFDRVPGNAGHAEVVEEHILVTAESARSPQR
jgi:hypothetical protein